MCNRCVISVSRPHHCCQHVRSSACVTEDCFTEVIQLEQSSVSPTIPAHFHWHFILTALAIHCGKQKNCSPCVFTPVSVFVDKSEYMSDYPLMCVCASVECEWQNCVSNWKSRGALWDSCGIGGQLHSSFRILEKQTCRYSLIYYATQQIKQGHHVWLNASIHKMEPRQLFTG